MGAPNFAFMLIGAVTGVLGNIFSTEGFTKRDWIPAAMGLSVGMTVCVYFVLCSGSLMQKVVRPWKVADENLMQQKKRWSSSTGRSVREFLDNYEASGGVEFKENPDGDPQLYAADSTGFADLGMPDVTMKLSGSGLDLNMLKKVNNDVLLDQVLKEAGLEKPGHRLKVIFFVRDASLTKDAGVENAT